MIHHISIYTNMFVWILLILQFKRILKWTFNNLEQFLCHIIKYSLENDS